MTKQEQAALLQALKSLIGCARRWPDRGEWKREGYFIELEDEVLVVLRNLIQRVER